MQAPTVLFLGQHAPLLHMLRNQVGEKFRVRQQSRPGDAQHSYNLEDVRMVVIQHDPECKYVLPDVRQFRRDIPDIPVLVFTSDFSGSNTRAFLKSGATDVFPLHSAGEEVRACYEAYLPGLADPSMGESTYPGEGAGLAEPCTDRVELKFLGFFSVSMNGRAIEFTKQARLLFAYLAYHHPRAFSRDHLARVFWPDKQENQPESARRSLNVELATIRKTLREQSGRKEDWIVFENNHYRLDLNAEIQSDVLDFKRLCHQIQDLKRMGKPVPDELYQSAMQGYSGEFLEDCPQDSMNWIAVERQHLSALFEQMAEQYTSQLFTTGDYWKASAVCHDFLVQDPNSEVIHRRLMLCFAKMGMCHKMEAQYKLLCHILKTRFQAKPSEDTQRIYEEIRQVNC